MPNPTPGTRDIPPEKELEKKPPEADSTGHIPPNALHTPTPPHTQPSDPRHYEKIPKLPSDE